MKPAMNTKKEVSILRCEGDLNAASVIKVKNRVARLVNQNQRRFILDLKQAKRVNLAALGILIDKLQKIRTLRADIRVIHVQPGVSQMFDQIGASRLIETFPSKQEAIRSYRVAA